MNYIILIYLFLGVGKQVKKEFCFKLIFNLEMTSSLLSDEKS